ncbi:MAG: patatin-like phospholipase family protein [Clostridia bacterium]|nr:patatin-like phospholipase family protein [Clostridia bacterium]
MKTALVLGGGGARGAYEVGVWKALRELGESFDIITGTSVGALNGAMAAQGDYDTAEALWSIITTEMVLGIEAGDGDDETLQRERESYESLSVTEKLARLGLFAREIVVNRGADTTPLRRLLEAHVDERQVRESGVELGLVTVRLEDGKPSTLYLDEIPEGMLIDYLMASSTVFPAMKKQTIGDKSYIDGGFYDSLPVELALARGAERIIAVDLATIGLYRRPVLPENVCVEYIGTAWNLGPILMFEPETSRRNMQLGYLDLYKSRGRFEGKLYAFEKGETALLMEAAKRSDLRWRTYFGTELARLLPALRLRILRTLRGKYRNLYIRGHAASKQTQIDPTLAAVENAAQVFELDPTVVYTAAEFVSALDAQIACTLEPDMQALGELADRSLRLQEKGEKLLQETEKLSSRSIARMLLREAEEPAGKELPRMLSPRQLAAVTFAFPAEAAAAAVAAALRTAESTGE